MMHELGFYESELKSYFTEYQWKDFENFMHGQTYTVINNDAVYYFCDVKRFCEINHIDYPRI
jgi:hypothetical protein